MLLPSSLPKSAILRLCALVANNMCPLVIGMISRKAITSGAFKIKKHGGWIFWLSKVSSSGTTSRLDAGTLLMVVG